MRPELAKLSIRRRRPPARGLLLLAAGLGIVLIVWLNVLPRIIRATAPPVPGGDPLAKELAHIKTLGLALRLHADEHNGKFPATIADIEWRQSYPGMKWDGTPAAVSRFHQPGSSRVSEWLYYRGKTEADPPETILVASPVAVGPQKDKRLVVRANGVAEVMKEENFQQEMSAGATP